MKVYMLELITEGDREYIGPFPTRERARSYGDTAEREGYATTYYVWPMSTPYAVVRRIEWRANEPTEERS